MAVFHCKMKTNKPCLFYTLIAEKRDINNQRINNSCVVILNLHHMITSTYIRVKVNTINLLNEDRQVHREKSLKCKQHLFFMHCVRQVM